MFGDEALRRGRAFAVLAQFVHHALRVQVRGGMDARIAHEGGGAAQADAVRQQRHAAGTGEGAEGDFGKAEFGAALGDQVRSAQGRFEAAAQGAALDQADGGDPVRRGENPPDQLQAAHRVGAQGAGVAAFDAGLEVGEVAAQGEMAGMARRQDEVAQAPLARVLLPVPVVAFDPVEQALEAGEQFRREIVRPPGHGLQRNPERIERIVQPGCERSVAPGFLLCDGSSLHHGMPDHKWRLDTTVC